MASSFRDRLRYLNHYRLKSHISSWQKALGRAGLLPLGILRFPKKEPREFSPVKRKSPAGL
jgi:hypothetical protein